MRIIIEIIFISFFIYTISYFCLWFIGLVISTYQLADSNKKKLYIKNLFPNSVVNKMPVSIIIPAYNEADCICETIDSLLNEDYPKLEIIVINDGSTDQTENLLVERYNMQIRQLSYTPDIETQPIKHYYHKNFEDKTLRFVCKENGGKSDALNCGINICKNSLCMIVDADTKILGGSIRIMASQFIMDKHVIVCAGAVNGNNENYNELSIFQKILVTFQKLEYYRTFYLQRIMFDKLNANIVVSGAFAMFQVDLIKKIGGYARNTIGEDMEITMRLHTFCASQKIKYRIAYVPEAKCITQFPFTYKDFYRQRLRWHIGMIQSMYTHRYMLGKLFYGWAGIISGTYFFLYEMFSHVIEFSGLITLYEANLLGILNLKFTLIAIVAYLFMLILIQAAHINIIDAYKVERICFMQKLSLLLISVFEIVFFHPWHILIKFMAFFKYRTHKRTWDHIQRH